MTAALPSLKQAAKQSMESSHHSETPAYTVRRLCSELNVAITTARCAGYRVDVEAFDLPTMDDPTVKHVAVTVWREAE